MLARVVPGFVMGLLHRILATGRLLVLSAAIICVNTGLTQYGFFRLGDFLVVLMLGFGVVMLS